MKIRKIWLKKAMATAAVPLVFGATSLSLTACQGEEEGGGGVFEGGEEQEGEVTE